ncbi:selenocysteine-specific translation elongation factor [Desulfosudis oleivorans]|uniref:Selenocysteine-specific elongation factor n=1 Tax=Desulfosudis oleivorans (strain DSM 6200 / JCM 39069 / Hxd3) TaxID=96561 RepID=A8ZUQ0_DESOH|nr:selenocysteine-specific translation elongation factor [Desulfosudis oleivorans]ABW66463.1 selenocysteine-specific translation elongation factor [Desulfosudis oleivorans Hxd3]
MRQLILGTAGHIDHGKSSFVKALTGTDPDRLKEEKARGITIELGFASLTLPGGQQVGIVDVPGHEKFIKNMVAGASGIDMVAMVIAADEGVMPQTREHMDICTLLGIDHGLVVLTKIDMVDEEMLELAMADVEDFTQNTFLEGAPVLPVSAVTGEGIAEFPAILERLAANVPDRNPTDLLRIPIDRVFSMKGFGTVITGTLVAGAVTVGETVELYPFDVRTRVRGLQVHNSSVERADAGLRTAINLQGLEKTEITRGGVVGRPDQLLPTYMLDIYFHALKSNARPIKHRAPVRVHCGTAEVMGQIILLDRETLDPGQDTVVQIRLKEPVVCVKDDRVVVRSYSPVRTIGGGPVLNPVPVKHRRNDSSLVEAIANLASAPPEAVIAFHCEQAGFRGVSLPALRVMTNLPDKALTRAMDGLLSGQTILLVDREKQVYVHKTLFDKTAFEMRAILDAFHRDNPLKKGMPRQDIKSRIARRAGDKLFERVLDRMVKKKEVVQDGDTVHLSGHAVALASDQGKIREDLLNLLAQSGLTPPTLKELPGAIGTQDTGAVREVLYLLVQQKDLVRVKDDLYFNSAVLERLESELVDFLNKNGTIDAPRFKEMTGASRKYTIPLLEYFDAKKVTIRVGDTRKLRQ